MEERRKQAFDNFIIKSSQSERFKQWFPENASDINLRNPKMYREDYARTQRLYNSPIYSMRRELNEDNLENQEEVDEDL